MKPKQKVAYVLLLPAASVVSKTLLMPIMDTVLRDYSSAFVSGTASLPGILLMSILLMLIFRSKNR